jgi:hypothetical protein
MITLALPQSSYATQIRAWARAIAAGRPQALAAAVHHQARGDLVQFFVDGNLEKRQDKLVRSLEFLAPLFPRFDELTERYMRAVPMVAYDSGQLDAGRMLDWLLENVSLSLEQRDFVACQHARQLVQDRAALYRSEHRAFQRLRREQANSALDWQADLWLLIHLNPVRAWMRLATPSLVSDGVVLPAWVLCYPLESELHSAVLGLEARRMLLDLERQAPCTFDEFIPSLENSTTDDILELGQSLADVGIVAFD